MNSKEKFSNKVSDYVKYRPSYPKELIDYLINQVGFSQNTVIADIGAGTGKLTKLLADNVKFVYAVEPNDNMRSACNAYCKEYNNVAAIDGSAEDTGLHNHSIDFVTVAQAFHWFDRNKSRIEFQRILKPKGKVVLVWNSKVTENALIKENDEFFRRVCPDFKGFSGGINIAPQAFADFFKHGLCEHRLFGNDSLLKLEEYVGGSLSSSYAPSESDENYEEFIAGLKRLFEKYSSNGKILLPNKTHVYIGEI
ncbi:class I SAM-dependent methyltransferase [Desulfosporosinus sp. SB140]|uniref:class I SAM-dependent methyltransferase n=1 Tax=Desulfosporosinus paludis TaxID=3115649 RepID=UPI00388E66E5